MTSIPFRCRLSANEPVIANVTAPLCLNGAICRVEAGSGRQFCECPSGYLHDFTAGHYPNCAIPNYLWAGMTGVVAVLTVLSMIVSVHAIQVLRGQVRRLMMSGAAAVLTNLAMMIATLADGGAFIPTIIFMLLFNMTTYRALMDAILLFTAPVYAVLQRNIGPFRQAITAMEVINLLAQLSSVISMMVFVREEDSARYNLASAVYLFLFTFGMIALGILVVRQARGLQFQVDSLAASLVSTTGPEGSQDSKLVGLRRRMDKMVKSHAALLVVFMFLWVLPITLLILGSFPYQFVLIFLMHVTVPCFVSGFAILYTQREERSPPPSAPSFKVKSAVNTPNLLIASAVPTDREYVHSVNT